MKTKEYSFVVDGKTYVIPVTYKYQTGIYLRAKGDGFTASAPTLCSERKVVKFISEALPTLIKRINKRKANEPLLGEGYTYILGKKVDKTYTKESMKAFALEYLTRLTRQVENEMGIKKPYKVHIREMRSRYGSNSAKTHSICYQLQLIHFSEEIIRSVVVHELAHDKHRNHQQKFYDYLLTYCPNYWDLKKKLRKGIPA